MRQKARQLNTDFLALAFRVSLVALVCMAVSVGMGHVLGPTATPSFVVVPLASTALVGLLLSLLIFTGVCVPLYGLIDSLKKPSLPKPLQRGWPTLTSAIKSALVETQTPPPRQVVR